LKGYSIRAALSGKLALEMIHKQPPALILLDVNMPDTDGIEVCRRIKANPLHSDIPIIFISGEHDTKSKVQAFATGGVDYITRPFQMDEVISRITTHLDLREQRVQLREMLQRMQELETFQNSLINMIIHDLRNPLWGIECYLDLIKTSESQNLSPQATSFITEAQHYTNNLIDMVNSILDVSRMEDGRLKLSLEKCDLAELCQQVIGTLESLTQTRSITITPTAAPVQATVDVALTRRLLTTLLTNAIRATQANEGRISLSTHYTHNNTVRVSITDNGRNIPAAEQVTLFEKYAQASAAIEGKGRYSPGLGLPFCKLVAEAHDGTIGITTLPDTCNQFWIELPCAGPQS
jgi:signal transduction histidine kinase